jgi:SAM-dependent methyltransferase
MTTTWTRFAVRNLDRAARLGEPSYVWRAGQDRRLRMILQAADSRVRGRILDNGCGVGLYLDRLSQLPGRPFGLEFDPEHAQAARSKGLQVLRAAGEAIPFPEDTFDLILSHEVIEHVVDDQEAVREMVRTLRKPDPEHSRPGGRLILFAPNRGYPFETHGVYWRGRYHFGNIPLVNYLPLRWRDRLAPHVRAYTRRDLVRLFQGLPVRCVQRTIIFGAYDNIIARWPLFGRGLRAVLQALEKTPLRALGLSHVWVLERT